MVIQWASVAINNQIGISRSQRDLHVRAEGAALLLGAPFLLYVASRKRALTSGEKAGLTAMALGTVVIDGYLLSKYRHKV